MTNGSYTLDPSERWLTFVWGPSPLPPGATFRGVVSHNDAPAYALFEFPSSGAFRFGSARFLRSVDPTLVGQLLAPQSSMPHGG